MNPAESATSPLRELLEKMVATRQLSPGDAQALARQAASGGGDAPVRSEEDVLRWLAKEYDLAFTALDDVEPDKEVISLFPARVLLKDELLPLRRVNEIGRAHV